MYAVLPNSAPLSAADAEAVERLLQVCIADFNRMQREELNNRAVPIPAYVDQKQFFIELPEYKRQYFAFINSRGEKEVQVNCFCTEVPNWRRQLVVVSDGGNCFFHVTVNLSNNTWHDMAANGSA
ncbi:hypothetical protein [Hymenobacter sp. B81]|uniref:hypothetical protein n=1 Tax=Hymenobacter sp. B81 TaxID=3344878 RepID=UPI0037DC7FF5